MRTINITEVLACGHSKCLKSLGIELPGLEPQIPAHVWPAPGSKPGLGTDWSGSLARKSEKAVWTALKIVFRVASQPSTGNGFLVQNIGRFCFENHEFKDC